MTQHLQSDGVQSEVPYISDRVVQRFFNTLELSGIFLQELLIVFNLHFCVNLCTGKNQKQQINSQNNYK